jgi:hypothetical protein
MDCSLLIGRQLDALSALVLTLERASGDSADRVACRELRDRAAAHAQVREQIVLPALQRGGWKGLGSEALAAHMELKRALAALCICEPGDGEFERVLQRFSTTLEQQRMADKLWIVPALRRLTSEADRRQLCEEIEVLYDSLIPPPDHYLESFGHTKPGQAVVQDAVVVLGAIGSASPGLQAHGSE